MSKKRVSLYLVIILLSQIFLFNGIFFIEVQAETEPQEIGKLDPEPLSYVTDVVVGKSDYCYIAQAPIEPNTELFLIVNISDPTNLTIVGRGNRTGTTGELFCCAVNEDETVAVVGGIDFYIFNITDKANPVRTVIWAMSSASDLVIIGDLVYCACIDYLRIVNISDLNNPMVIDTWDEPVYCLDYDAPRNCMYAGTKQDGSGIIVFGIYSNGSLYLMDNIAIGHDIYGIKKRSHNQIYVGNIQGQIYVIDTVDLNDIRIETMMDIEPSVVGIAHSNVTMDYFYVAGAGEKLYVMKIDDNPLGTYLSYYRSMGATGEVGAMALDIKDSYVFLAGTFNLYIYSLSDCISAIEDGNNNINIIGISFKMSVLLTSIGIIIGLVVILSKNIIIQRLNSKKDN